jgi:hypothetical protein
VGNDDMFILRLDGDGDLVHAASLGGTDNDRGYAIASSNTGAVYLTGWFAGTTDLDPGSGTLNAVSAGGNDAFLIKLIESDGTGMDEGDRSGKGITIYPNPADSHVTIMLDANVSGQRGSIEVFDATGKRVHAEQVQAYNRLQKFDLSSDLSEDLYLIVLHVEGQGPRSARVTIRR